MANLRGLASFVSELRVERTNLVDRLRHVDAALSVLGKLGGGGSHRTALCGTVIGCSERLRNGNITYRASFQTVPRAEVKSAHVPFPQSKWIDSRP
jgi:hypothetical protein